MGVGGTANVAVFATTGVSVLGTIVGNGNVTGGNILTGGLISATANVTGGNIFTTGSGGDIVLTGGSITGARSVATTPTALVNLTAVAGGRAFINNANLVAAGNFGNQVGSGGSNVVPVWSNGTNWYIG